MTEICGGDEFELVSIEQIFPGYKEWCEKHYGTIEEPKLDKDGFDLSARIFCDTMIRGKIERENVQTLAAIDAVCAEVTKVTQEAIQHMREFKPDLVGWAEIIAEIKEKRVKSQQNLSSAISINMMTLLDIVDLNRFQAALLVSHISDLVFGGGHLARPDDDAYDPKSLIVFIERVLTHAQHTSHFEEAWKQLQNYMPQCNDAWEQGKILFQYDLDRAETDPEDMGYLQMIDFALDCYADPNAKRMYPGDRMLCKWFANGYMVAWRGHFLANEEASDDYCRSE